MRFRRILSTEDSIPVELELTQFSDPPLKSGGKGGKFMLWSFQGSAPILTQSRSPQFPGISLAYKKIFLSMGIPRVLEALVSGSGD